jgi:arginyl-tRNA synthetase
MERFKPLLAEALSKAVEFTVDPKELETPPDRNLGDFAYPCFKLSKNLRKAPPVIASEISEKTTKFIDGQHFEVKAVGPYVNFIIKPEHLSKLIQQEILGDENANYGALPENSREKWVFEFSSPNVAKPFQIYHLRTTIVGSALSPPSITWVIGELNMGN